MSALIHKQPLLPVLALGIGGVALSMVLMPRGRELALLQLSAGKTVQALSMLEARMRAGDRTLATIGALARARIDSGDMVGAARLYEDLVAERPRNAAALRALEEIQRSIGHTEGLVRTLERLQDLSPTLSRAREIASLHASHGNAAGQRQALRLLVTRFAGTREDYLALARLEAAGGNPRAGAAVLRRLELDHPEDIEASIVALEMSMLLAARQSDQALLRARGWVGAQAEPERSVTVLAGAFGAGGRPDLAVSLLQPFARPGADPDVFTVLAQALHDIGNPAAGLELLERLDTDFRPAALMRLRLALDVEEVDRSVTAAYRAGTSAVPRDLLARLADKALWANRIDVLKQLLTTEGDRIFESDPVLAARIFLALDDTPTARRWSDVGLRAEGISPVRLVQLAAVEARLGRSDRVHEVLSRVVRDPALHPSLFREIAGIYARAGQAERGLAAMEALRRERPLPEADLAWAIAASAAGRADDVVAWLRARGPTDLPADALQDLAYLAADAKAHGLAIEAAERLLALRQDSGDAALVIRLLVDAGRPRQALERLRGLPPGTVLPTGLREAILLSAWREGAPVGDELRETWTRRLREAPDLASRSTAVTILRELKAYDDLLPVLRQLAENDPEAWMWTFTEVASAADRLGEVNALWARLGSRADLPAAQRRSIAFRLLDNGNRAAAERIFRTLASAAPAASADVRQLLFLWGLRPTAEQLDWIEARARRTAGTELAAWMGILVNHGAPARAAAVYRAASRDAEPDVVHQAYITVLSGLDNRPAMAAAVRDGLARTSTPEGAERLVQLSARVGDADLERRALERLVALGGGGSAAQRRLGMLAYARKDMEGATRHLMAFTRAGGGDYETRMLLGDIAIRQRSASEAATHYGEALRLLQASGDRSFRARTVAANLLHRVGRNGESERLYAELVAERPADSHLRADYVAMLMAQGALTRAREVLGNR